MQKSVFIAAALLASTALVHAQSAIPPSGDVHVTFTTAAVPPSKLMDVGDGGQYVQINLIMTATNDQGNPILNNMAGRCQLTRLLANGKQVESHGYCTYSDNDGDLIFEKCDIGPGSNAPAGAVNLCQLTGGTGKFTGLQASLVITSTPPLKSPNDTYQSVGHKTGTYKIVAASH
jgi:hypothetical protein